MPKNRWCKDFGTKKQIAETYLATTIMGRMKAGMQYYLPSSITTRHKPQANKKFHKSKLNILRQYIQLKNQITKPLLCPAWQWCTAQLLQ